MDNVSDAELLDLVLARRHVGPSLLARFGGLRGLGRAGLSELREVEGVGRRLSHRIGALCELSRRLAREPLAIGRPFRGAPDIVRHFRPELRDLKKERFLAVLLDGKYRVMDHRRISEGSLNASLVHPREVFCPAIRESAGAIVLVHNHPSGDPSPSREDLEVTRRLVEVGELVGIQVLDHVILGEDSHTSLLERGLLRGMQG